MNPSKNDAVERYLNRIRQEIYNLAPIDDFIEMLRNDLYEYEKSNPDCTEEDLESEFGTPEEIAKDYLDENNVVQPKEVAKSKRKKNIIIAILIVALVVVSAYLIDLHRHQQAMATDVIIIED
ncbi:MAG: hypothetical protein PUE18_06670 [Firmicutes bacterium]|nr:hypothetical protein [Bacillota bacterium]